MRAAFIVIAALLFSKVAGAQVSACNATQDRATSVADVQLTISEALGVTRAVNDLNGDSVVNVLDVQIVINSALGLGCSAVSVTLVTPASGTAGLWPAGSPPVRTIDWYTSSSGVPWIVSPQSISRVLAFPARASPIKVAIFARPRATGCPVP